MNIDRKFHAPTNLSSFEEYGYCWLADLESGVQIWIQTSEDMKSPKWIRLGELFEISYIKDPKSLQKITSSMLNSLE